MDDVYLGSFLRDTLQTASTWTDVDRRIRARLLLSQAQVCSEFARAALIGEHAVVAPFSYPAGSYIWEVPYGLTAAEYAEFAYALTDVAFKVINKMDEYQ